MSPQRHNFRAPPSVLLAVPAAPKRRSENPKIVIFWFSPRANPRAHTVTGLAAYNTRGKLLPLGHNSPGVG